MGSLLSISLIFKSLSLMSQPACPPLNHPTTYPLISQTAHSSTHPYIYSSIHSPNHPPINPSFHTFPPWLSASQTDWLEYIQLCFVCYMLLWFLLLLVVVVVGCVCVRACVRTCVCTNAHVPMCLCSLMLGIEPMTFLMHARYLHHCSAFLAPWVCS